MENASKALLMAAGVLMGVLILSLAVYLFANFRATADEATKLMYEEELAQFNNFYLSYDGKTDLTYYDVWNVVNKAKENNKKEQEGNNYYVEVYLNNVDITNISSFGINNASKLNIGGDVLEYKSNPSNPTGPPQMVLKEYTCKVSINNVTGRVSRVDFK